MQPVISANIAPYQPEPLLHVPPSFSLSRPRATPGVKLIKVDEYAVDMMRWLMLRTLRHLGLVIRARMRSHTKLYTDIIWHLSSTYGYYLYGYYGDEGVRP